MHLNLCCPTWKPPQLVETYPLSTYHAHVGKFELVQSIVLLQALEDHLAFVAFELAGLCRLIIRRVFFLAMRLDGGFRGECFVTTTAGDEIVALGSYLLFQFFRKMVHSPVARVAHLQPEHFVARPAVVVCSLVSHVPVSDQFRFVRLT